MNVEKLDKGTVEIIKKALGKKIKSVKLDFDNKLRMQALVVQTDKGAFTVVTHNEHNGYYGGFWLEAAYK